MDNPDLIIYTDGSKEEDRVGAAWALTAGDMVLAEEAYRLNDEATVFQAEVAAIREALVYLNSQEKYKKATVQIRSDSQAAIAAILKTMHKSKLTRDCAGQLAVAQDERPVQIAWIKGHADHTGNELADVLAKQGNSKPYDGRMEVPVPVRYAKRVVEEFYYSSWQRQWEAETKCTHTREMFPTVNRGKLKQLLRMNRKQLAILIEAATGHGLVAYHLAHWKSSVDPTCKLCLEDDEKFTHLLHECPALWREQQEMQGRLERSSNPVAYERELIRYFMSEDMKALYQLNAS